MVLYIIFPDILAHFYALDTFMEIRRAVVWLATESSWAWSEHCAEIVILLTLW